ncbi:MAG: hypothetical protein PVJ39_21220 [Gammaproteobacteria bacterium]|jgi:uncharacterized protein YjgD (DUF1641 family)
MPTAKQESVSVELERLAASAQDALTDDMVSRLAANASQTLDLLDRFNRSGIDRALPTIAQLVENGDLERLVGFARLFGSVEDSLSDDIVNRLALVITELACLVDKLARNEGFQRLIELLGKDEVQESMVNALSAASAAKTEAESLPRAKGGFGGLWQLVTDPDTQEAMRFMVLMSKQLKKS